MNGVVERFILTPKKQSIYGRVFRKNAEVRLPVAKFVKDFNVKWRVEKTDSSAFDRLDNLVRVLFTVGRINNNLVSGEPGSLHIALQHFK
jgi:hypothetical protein